MALGDKLTRDRNFKGPVENRRCTDVLCLLLLLGCWAGMTLLGMIATGVIKNDVLPAGEPLRLVNG